MNNNDLLNLIYPPQWVSKLLHIYISGAQSYNNHGIKTELIYLTLPLLTIDEIRDRLNHANKTTTFNLIFEDSVVPNKQHFTNFPQKIESFIDITNEGLIVLNADVSVTFCDYITVSKLTKHTKINDEINADYYKAAYYLGLILAKSNHSNIFMKLGVVPA
ncbi:three component ABC system middle component [uncultured Methanolobus sp.]|uniref:three component ABC system middle component n=1 Tax=uncultured Methanolobus sp. TaxID=218300 RepID=UPI002AAC0004|nr:three component ABC system middle component [uncultured Methanolobus sp.]